MQGQRGWQDAGGRQGIRRAGWRCDELPVQCLNVATMAIPFAKGNPQFKAAIDQALSGMKADGTFKKISLKWFGIDVSKVPTVAKQ
ncbi:transporter substrate-binding domain-containing protein [Chromobacterium amazonense]|uniref:transporter substrate-binding domain-containing protein n=1 Tax=Chromobacterium amazonense TaxID=1382803 RepID=UPI003B9681FC